MSIQFFTPRGPRNEVLRLPSSLRRTVKWLPRIGDIFPDFTVETTQGVIRFWDWAEGHWVHLFSHPAAHTPICTTELVSISASASAWDACNVRHMALTGSTVAEQVAWHEEIEAFFGTPIDVPGAHDPALQLTRLFGMRHEKQSTEFSIRKSFIIDPAQRIRMIFEYPINIGRNTEEVLRVIKALQMSTRTGAATPADWHDGDPVFIKDDRSEQDVVDVFGTGSLRLTPYLRVVTPQQGRTAMAGMAPPRRPRSETGATAIAVSLQSA